MEEENNLNRLMKQATDLLQEAMGELKKFQKNQELKKEVDCID